MTDYINNVHTDLHRLEYSTCIDPTTHHLQRRVLSGTSVGTGGDGGTTTTVTDMGTATMNAGLGATGLGDSSLHTDTAGVDGGVDDGGSGGGTDDGGMGPTPGVGPFTSLNKIFVCSDKIETAGTHYSQRIGALTNGQSYSFIVVGIDQSGNPTPSKVVSATPQPVEDLYRRFRDEGGSAQGFCFIATAAYGSYEDPYVRVLRDFRDQALMPYSWGRGFVDWYYRTSPPYADYIARHPVARWLVRQALWPVIGGAALWLWLTWWQQALVFAGLGGSLARWRRRRRAARLRAEGAA
jgi:hypothetical protein